jgi:plasmid replication initiation protein
MAERHLTSLNPVVKISNALARASRAVKSVYEPRLVALVASRVRQDDCEFQEYEISLSDLLGSASDGRTHKLVANVADSLMGRVLTLPRANGWAKYGVFSKCEYDGQAGVIRARFDPDLRPHFLSLNEYFTEYSLTEFLLLPSIYSQRLFEVLKSWDDKPQVDISLVDLFSMLDVPASHRSDFAAFRRRVLEKAKKDITEKTALRFDWEAIKKGRAVASVRFTFGRRAVGVESKKAEEQKQKTSESNNSLMKKAVKCFREKGENCQPQKSKMCDLCLRLVKLVGQSPNVKSTAIDIEKNIVPSELSHAVDKTPATGNVKNDSPSSIHTAVDDTWADFYQHKGISCEDSITRAGFVSRLVGYKISRELAEAIYEHLLAQGNIQSVWVSLFSIDRDLKNLSKKQRKHSGSFVVNAIGKKFFPSCSGKFTELASWIIKN